MASGVSLSAETPSFAAVVTPVSFCVPVSPVHGLMPLYLDLASSAGQGTGPGSFYSHPVCFYRQ